MWFSRLKNLFIFRSQFTGLCSCFLLFKEVGCLTEFSSALPYVYMKYSQKKKKKKCFAEDESLIYLIQRVYLIWGCIKQVSQPTTKQMCIPDPIFLQQTQCTIFCVSLACEGLFWFISEIFKISLVVSCVLQNSAGYEQTELLSGGILNCQAAGKTRVPKSSCWPNCRCEAVWLTLPLLDTMSSLSLLLGRW